jgi:membrane associated rhomboid family serine protease
MESVNDKSSLTEFRKEIPDKVKIFDAVAISLLILMIIWSIFILDEYLGFHFRQYGLTPRTFEGWRGIFTMHFLHSDLKHIAQNSMGLLVLNSFLFYFYRSIGFQVFLILFFFSPVLLWFIGRDGNHIGASVMIYGEFAFLFISGLVRRNPLLMRVALAVVLYYGSLVWYLFPIDQKISWEGHLSGFAIGAFAAVLLRNKGPQRTKYRFEVEPDLPDDDNAYWKIKPAVTDVAPSEEGNTNAAPRNDVKINYEYKEKNPDQSGR